MIKIELGRWIWAQGEGSIRGMLNTAQHEDLTLD